MASLNHPTSPGIKRMTMQMRVSAGQTRSPFTFQRQVQMNQGQMWMASFDLPPMERDEAEEWLAFLTKLNGRAGTFLLGDPDAVTPRGAALGTPQVKGADQTGSTLVTDGWDADVTGVLKAGDYIQVGERLHKLLDDADSDATGEATLSIWPRLRESPADNAIVTINGAKGRFCLAGNVNGWSTDDLMMYGLSFSAEEAF